MVHKIAICFLITKNIINPEVWQKWWSGNEDKINIYVHYSKGMESKVTLPFLVNNRVPPVPTKWGDISLVNAECQLYTEAYKKTSNKFFILVSDTCIPIRSFTYVYKRLMRNLDKGIAPFRAIDKWSVKYSSPDEFQPFIPSESCINKMKLRSMIGKTLYAIDQWKILSRKNVKDFRDMMKNKTFVRIFTSCIEIVPDSLAPDELMFANYLRYKYSDNLGKHLRYGLVTFVDFVGKAIHPVNYKNLTVTVAGNVCFNNAMFARKFIKHNPKIAKKIPVKCYKRYVKNFGKK